MPFGRITNLTYDRMENSRKKYSIDFKIWAVKTCMEHKSVRLAANKLKINKNSLQHWKNLFRNGKLTLPQTPDPDLNRNEIVQLQKELKNIRMERDILKEDSGLFHLGRRAIYQFIRENTGRFPVGKMCKAFQVDPSCYYKWHKGLPTSRTERRIFITSEISRIYHWSEGRYGSLRISRELASLGIKACPSLVRKILAEQQLHWIAKLKFKSPPLLPKIYCGRKFIKSGFQGERTKPGMGLRHHLHQNRRRMGISHYCYRPV